MLATMTRKVLDYREVRSIRRHRTRMERRMAEPYTAYWEQARRTFPGAPPLEPDIARAVREFTQQGLTSFWTPENNRLAESMFQTLRALEQPHSELWRPQPEYNCFNLTTDVYRTFEEVERLFQGSLGQFLNGVFQSYFKIFYGTLFRSEHLTDKPTGSQLWHDDGGPGTCINVLFYLKDVTVDDGAWAGLPWASCFEIYRKALPVVRQRLRIRQRQEGGLSRNDQRQVRCAFYEEEISRGYADRILQPVGRAGMIVPFRNNIIHRGGYPKPGHTRYVCIFHCYPSHKPTPYERYRSVGMLKTAGLPKDPAGDF